MRRPLKRALAATALLTLASSSVLGWSVAVHLVTDDHHDRSHHDGVLGLGMALHGHAHSDETPPHQHPVIGSVAASLPGKLQLQTGATVGHAPEMVCAGAFACRLSSPTGSTHDPPPRLELTSVLRI